MRNAPHKPLASGAVAPDAALLLSSALYCAVLIVTCFMVRGWWASGWVWVAQYMWVL